MSEAHDQQPNTPSQAQPQAGSFEQTLGHLQQVVQRLNQPDLPLDEALQIYQRGVELAARGRELLTQAERQVSSLQGTLRGGDEPSP